MTEDRYFVKPTQVKFYDDDAAEWLGGIAYENYIICGCCGSIMDIEEIYEYCPDDVKRPIIPFVEWIDINREIIGE